MFAVYIISLVSRLFSLNFNKEDLLSFKETHQSLSVPQCLSKHLTQPQKKFHAKCHLPEIPNFNEYIFYSIIYQELLYKTNWIVIIATTYLNSIKFINIIHIGKWALCNKVSFLLVDETCPFLTFKCYLFFFL